MNKINKLLAKLRYRKSYNSQISFLKCSDLNFIPTPYQVIYLEYTYNEDVNSYIGLHIHQIQQIFAQYNLEFIYLPAYVNDPSYLDIVHYNNPSKTYPHKTALEPQYLTTAITKKFLETATSRYPTGPMLMMLYDQPHESYTFETSFVCFHLTDQPIQHQLEACAIKFAYKLLPPYYVSTTVFYNITSLVPGPEIWSAIEEVKDKVEYIKSQGFYHLLMEALYPDTVNKLSPIHIDENGRIFLPDYQNIEITMPPLSKALYILYLHHPEGISFSSLYKYEPELFGIYSVLSNRCDWDALNKSIKDLVDPLSNSIHEKCSRIKRAFLAHFNDHLAKYYYITGPQGEAKSILLPSHLIRFDDEFMQYHALRYFVELDKHSNSNDL